MPFRPDQAVLRRLSDLARTSRRPRFARKAPLDTWLELAARAVYGARGFEARWRRIRPPRNVNPLA